LTDFSRELIPVRIDVKDFAECMQHSERFWEVDGAIRIGLCRDILHPDFGSCPRPLNQRR